MGGHRFTVAVLLVLGLGCAPTPDSTGDGTFVPDPLVGADVILSFTTGGVPQQCSMGLPPCDGSAVAPCGPSQVLGAADGIAHVLEPGGVLELGFRCGALLERGGLNSFDLTVVATVPPGATAVVEVSEENLDYAPLLQLTDFRQSFDIAEASRQVVRFIRISDPGGVGGIAIDAVIPAP